MRIRFSSAALLCIFFLCISKQHCSNKLQAELAASLSSETTPLLGAATTDFFPFRGASVPEEHSTVSRRWISRQRKPRITIRSRGFCKNRKFRFHHSQRRPRSWSRVDLRGKTFTVIVTAVNCVRRRVLPLLIRCEGSVRHFYLFISTVKATEFLERVSQRHYFVCRFAK